MSAVYHYMIVLSAAHILAVSTTCEEGAVRFDPGRKLSMGPHAGYVQLCDENQWKRLCGGLFNRLQANIICRQLGYIGKIERGVQSQSAQGPSISVNPQACSGHENALTECQNLNKTTEYSCGLNHWVQCLPDNCTDGSLRLVGGATPWEGRVEVCVGGRWGTVCYNEQLTETVCQQLGFGSQGANDSRTNTPGHKTNCMLNYNNNSLHCTMLNYDTQPCDGHTVQCETATFTVPPTNETMAMQDNTNNINLTTIVLSVVIGLLVIVEIVTLILCCIKQRRSSNTPPKIISQISYHRSRSTHTLDRENIPHTLPTGTVPAQQEPTAPSNEAQGHESMLPNEGTIEGYQTVTPQDNKVIDNYETIIIRETEGYETMNNHKDNDIESYDYVANRRPPPIPPYRPDGPAKVGGVSDNDDEAGYVYSEL